MLDRLNIVKLPKGSREDWELADWAWESHWWVETYEGYFTCKRCNKHHTSMMGIDKNYPLCKENYVIKKLLKENK